MGIQESKKEDRIMESSGTREGERQDNEGFRDQRGRETGQ